MTTRNEIVIDEYNTSYFDNVYDNKNRLKGTENRKKQIPTDVFINRINNDKKLTSASYSILPLNCRYSMEMKGGYKLFVIEEPPQMRTIYLDYDISETVAGLSASGNLKKFGYEKWFEENKKPYQFYLAFPYIIYIILLNHLNQYVQLKIFSRVTPLSSFGDYMCKIPLMNINSNQSVCMGSFTKKVITKNPTTAIESVIKTFWQNVFNQDLIYNVQAYIDIPFVCDYLTWQYHSKQDPMFIYNIEWIPYKSVGFEINKTIRGYEKPPSESYSLHNLIEKVFYKATATTLEDSKTKSAIHDNVADSINIDRIPIFVNDSFMLKNKRNFVMSFMSPPSSHDITHIKLQDPDKNIKTYRLTKRFKDKLRKCIMEERFIQSTTLSDGTIVEQGSIIRSTNVHGNKVYNKIDYMRYGLDGKIEARVKSCLTALEDMKDIKIIDMKNIKINGVNLNKGKGYSVLFDYSHYYRNSSAPIKIIRKLILNDIDISSTGKILTRFEDSSGKRFSIDIENLNKRIINDKKFKKLPSICRLGTSMIGNEVIKIHPDMTNYLFMENISSYIPDYNTTMSTILKDKEHLFIESFDMNLSFKVGDKVVASDWLNPGEMLKVKTIMGFKATEERAFNILLEDQHGNKSEHTYLKKTSSNFTVNVGTLRHIEKEYNGITSGTKIKANIPRISNFPMNATNIIIGFLSDTGGDIPLVLCSNGATLWADDLIENFNLTTMSNKKWKSLKHVPIMDQRYFKFQPGDMTTIPYNRNQLTQNLLTIQYTGDKLICQYLNDEHALNPRFSGYFAPELKSITNRIAFLNPRYSQKQLLQQKLITAYPNFHGMYNFNSNVRMKYHVDERRIINVSNLPV